MINIQPLVNDIGKTVASHQLDRPGAYRRWLWQEAPTQSNAKPRERDLGVNEYGVADAANLLYTIGRFPSDPTERASWVEVLRGLQKPDTGLYVEATHNRFHTTAHCIAALELFDKKPLYPIKAMDYLHDKDALEKFLDGLDWLNNPWAQSHQGAGVYASLVLADEVPLEWEDWYFGWLYENADPKTGLWRKDHIGNAGPRGVFPHLAGTFHYLFNHEYAHRPLRYPDKLVDFCLDVYNRDLYPVLGKNTSFAEVDWVYCLTRALQQSGHRFADARVALEKFATDYTAMLLGLDKQTHDGWNDLHNLFGVSCCLAELQQAVPGLLRSETPLKLVLDRRPFI